jgi:hypothetical protein
MAKKKFLSKALKAKVAADRAKKKAGLFTNIHTKKMLKEVDGTVKKAPPKKKRQ